MSDTSFILIVDDNPTNLSVLAQTLRSEGFAIRIAPDGVSALQQLEEVFSSVALILLDVQMPGIDGFETCRRLKANPNTHDIPVIFMTALADTESKVKGLSLGAVDYITKPFEGEEVLARIRIHLQMRELTKQLQGWNALLEQRVQERTSALQSTQVQLVQQEKFATIGQLVAGVAHEINNPVGCIVNNVAPAHQYLNSLTKVIGLYQKHYPDPEDEIQQALIDEDIDFALEDLANLLQSVQVSALRIKDISVSLRSFSRNDSSTTKVLADVHEGIDSTLLILQHRLKPSGKRPAIQVIKQYGDLPQVKCYPGLLNQVCMNLLANAIEALEEAMENKEDFTPQIHIYTQVNNTPTPSITILFADNGIGMSESVKQRLFEPLFTTKPPDKGTGLGLSIARQIIEDKHFPGCLSCKSQLGQGTEFIITLPV
ncbi:response regulator receiver sensor signal transduction histidine kinase [Calothrix sp. NIES-4071]|nr:response regulator receiver sensor signal transduction histidine kinase [Calothrix sp. NIES-4071]BAZ61864.1 response regulator receiver sensor signal transduction histidine kinase [Calothrix sp. NIES-4105]